MRKLILDKDSGERRVQAKLLALGWEVLRATDLGWDELDDEVVLERAVAMQYSVYSANRADFARIAKRWAIEGRTHCGIILRAPQLATPEAQLSTLLELDADSPDDWSDLVLWATAR